ncbi:hypothetical protein I532_16823 [Brevibacillus borstelensis AK1]|jgi:hypothetical protein|uniref:Uncharacterized protein n=1 Tax=Brevibacillus borstelensis AK1 TaxID=1300222 RepID=M8DE07_9BACL|nr:hypothetical protein I532_16823 [Brevibacillus borstelensis AK1]
MAAISDNENGMCTQVIACEKSQRISTLAAWTLLRLMFTAKFKNDDTADEDQHADHLFESKRDLLQTEPA